MNDNGGTALTAALEDALKDIKFDHSKDDVNLFIAKMQEVYSRMQEAVPTDIRFYHYEYAQRAHK